MEEAVSAGVLTVVPPLTVVGIICWHYQHGHALLGIACFMLMLIFGGLAVGTLLTRSTLTSRWKKPLPEKMFITSALLSTMAWIILYGCWHFSLAL